MALTKLRGNIIATGTVSNSSIQLNTIANNKLAAPFTTGKAIAMSMVFG
tara:strand:+ start:3205 stop:3351 length:147 start_codon:yes stop_codon:yes gene_type:complete